MPETNAIIDISHFNATLDFQTAKTTGGIAGVFHKATQGLTYRDPTYQTHKQAAQAAGLLWGAYHFGTGSDGVSQAQYFLDFVNPGAG